MKLVHDQIKNAINKAYVSLTVEGLLKEKLSISIKPNYETACWAFKPPHEIFIGDKILENVKDGVADEDQQYYIASFLYHEVGHYLYTVRDLQAFGEILKKRGVTFDLFNVFEDARIEEALRKETGRDFRWAQYEEVIPPTKPLSILNSIIQEEGAHKIIYEEAHASVERIVEYYYPAIIAAQSSYDLIPILIEWTEEFKGESSEDKESSESETSKMDLKMSMLLQDDKAFAQFLEDSIGVSSASPHKELEAVEENTSNVEEYSSGKLCDYPLEWPREEADKLTPMFAQLFRDKKGYQNTSTPQKRLNARGIARGSLDLPYRKKTIERPAQKEVVLILDVSGSMGGSPLEGMKVIVGIFSRLAKMGHVKGHVILSGVHNEKAKWETFKLPISDNIIDTFVAKYEAEGIEFTIQNNVALLKKADWVFCLTDGHITDAPISKKTMNGISVFGIFVGDETRCNLSKWFNKGVARATVKGVADELLRLLK